MQLTITSSSSYTTLTSISMSNAYLPILSSRGEKMLAPNNNVVAQLRRLPLYNLLAFSTSPKSTTTQINSYFLIVE